ncbi:MAG: BTAD domain-containing putative transcriptional regulator [Caldilineaceae bacterium]
MAAPLDLRLLGPIKIAWNGKPVTGFESRKALALLCYLVEQKRPIARASLAHLFWGDKEEQRGRANLSRVLHNLTTLLPDCLEVSRDTIEFRPSASALVDIDFFIEATKGNHIPSLVEAVAAYRGHFMADITLKDCPEFDAWLVTTQEMWSQRMASVLHTLIAYYKNSGEYEQGLKIAARFLAQDPWREEAHREMMLMLALSGQRTAALAQYEKCCDILHEELGVNPSAETTALYYRIRNGEVRTKTTTPPIVNYIPQVMQYAQPLQPSLTTTPVVVEKNGNGATLGAYAVQEESHLLNGRRSVNEFDQILQRLANPACRMLTLVGPNNAIQKRLLFEVTSSLTKAFRHGVYFVTNRSIHHSLLVDIAYSLNLTKDELLWDEEGRTHIWLFKQLREKELLLTIADIELYDASISLLEEILKRAPLVKLLISAQTPLQMNVEWIFDIY